MAYNEICFGKANNKNVIFFKKCTTENALISKSLEMTLFMRTFFCYDVDNGRFYKCSGFPKDGYLEGREYLYFDIYHASWSQDLCSLIDAMGANSFRESSATFIEDTFWEIQDYIFNTFEEPEKKAARKPAVSREISSKVSIFTTG